MAYQEIVNNFFILKVEQLLVGSHQERSESTPLYPERSESTPLYPERSESTVDYSPDSGLDLTTCENTPFASRPESELLLPDDNRWELEGYIK